ncbi:hypothetical protein C0081_01155 [Cohaesibacter celericrescens]|uniref:Uncharacterized protein n=1 Tax=Cohaesibacter celericrescens TaxID=2067669 RepID=A0A2N5XLQ7_9HYPH|nr:hypothetical protein C0081_19195 [Cohaesibacter celericrescens]PLW78878.1 hypothetical protein C0081_01155 [Cohaesibacter celericrescens]
MNAEVGWKIFANLSVINSVCKDPRCSNQSFAASIHRAAKPVFGAIGFGVISAAVVNEHFFCLPLDLFVKA